MPGGGAAGIHGQHGSMLRFGNQATDQFFEGGGFEAGQFRFGFARHPFGEGATDGDRRRAAASFVADFGDAASFEADRESHDVAAGGIHDLHGHRGRRKLADVAGILEVID